MPHHFNQRNLYKDETDVALPIIIENYVPQLDYKDVEVEWIQIF